MVHLHTKYNAISSSACKFTRNPGIKNLTFYTEIQDYVSELYIHLKCDIKCTAKPELVKF